MLPFPTKTSDHVTLFAPSDLVTTNADTLSAYIDADVPDVATITARDGAPRYTLRPLTEREMALARNACRDGAAGDVNFVAMTYETLRWALVSATGMDTGELPQRERLYGSLVLPVSAIETIPEFTAMWLSVKVWKWSMPSEEKKRPSGSSPINGNGTAPTASGAAPLTAGSAATTPN